MKEQLQGFISAYDEISDAHIAKSVANLEKAKASVVEWKKERADAIELGKSLGVDKEIIKFFPEEGGFNGRDPWSGVDPGYIELLNTNDELSKLLNLVWKRMDSTLAVARAEKGLSNANALKEKGGEYYFNHIIDRISSVIANISLLESSSPSTIWNRLIADPEKFKHALDSSQFNIEEGPRGVLSIPQLYSAVVEHGNPITLSKSSINESEAEEPITNGIDPLNEDESVKVESNDDLATPINEGNGTVETNPQVAVSANIPQLNEEISSIDESTPKGESSERLQESSLNEPEIDRPVQLAPETSILNIENTNISNIRENSVNTENTKMDSNLITSVLEGSASKEEITNLQQQLIQQGFKLPKFGADGVLGKETISAINNYQSSLSVKSDNSNVNSINESNIGIDGETNITDSLENKSVSNTINEDVKSNTSSDISNKFNESNISSNVPILSKLDVSKKPINILKDKFSTNNVSSESLSNSVNKTNESINNQNSNLTSNDVSNSKSETVNNTSNKSDGDNIQSTPIVNVDMKAVIDKLSKIERLLSTTLDVRIKS